MDKVDFIEIANYCVNRYKESHNNPENIYVDTLYAAITKDNQVLTSSTPHILRNANKCILIHQRSKLALSNWYSWYKIEYINEEGCVFDIELGNGFTLDIMAWGSYANQVMSLDYEGEHIYWCKRPWTDKLPKVWEMYTKVKDLKTKGEIALIAELFRKDETILKLEKEKEDFKYKEELLKQERDQYKDLLDEIKEMVESK